MHILNFAHPLTDLQLEQIKSLLQPQTVEKVHQIPVQFDPAENFLPQLETLLSAIPLTTVELQSLPILINLPSLNSIAALLLTSLHGRMGYFPSILRLRSKLNQTPPVFEVAEIINLQSLRDQSRSERY
jgi:hypothetical protein